MDSRDPEESRLDAHSLSVRLDLSGLEESESLREALADFHPVPVRPGVPLSLWEVASNEFEIALQGDSPAYADVRREWESLKDAGADAVVRAIVRAMSMRIGVGDAVLTPIVRRLLALALRRRRPPRVSERAHEAYLVRLTAG